MSNELVPFKANFLPAVQADVLGEVAEVSKGSDFLPRIQLVTKGKYVDTGKIAPGHWGIPQPGGEEIVDLGTSIDIIPLDARAKAIDMSDREAIVAVYKTGDPEFQRIKAAPKNSGCMWGPSFLVIERSTGKLYELFFGNASGRNEAGKLRPFLPSQENGGVPQPATLGIRYKKMPDYGWHVPVISRCSEPFDSADCPPNSVIQEEIEKFRNPKAGVQKVDEEGNEVPDKPNKRAR
jgi:hypothetical protein